MAPPLSLLLSPSGDLMRLVPAFPDGTGRLFAGSSLDSGARRV